MNLLIRGIFPYEQNSRKGGGGSTTVMSNRGGEVMGPEVKQNVPGGLIFSGFSTMYSRNPQTIGHFGLNIGT